jgi:hypothetical protein
VALILYKVDTNYCASCFCYWRCLDLIFNPLFQLIANIAVNFKFNSVANSYKTPKTSAKTLKVETLLAMFD